ncbi:hypothetical protein GYMLUDRAFT_147950 [Collybiopsis luxurians FD-317 M1]|nr:hypothetical protein GYMLUDRAFT_147950 [Collybiopsis luxurians FD-317 M1]
MAHVSSRQIELTPTSPFTLPLLYLILVFGLTCRSRSSRRCFFVVIFSLAYYVVVYTNDGYSPMTSGNAGLSVTIVFEALDYLVISDPHAELRLVGQTQSVSTASFLDRLLWSIKLVLSPRGIGWTHEPKSVIPPHPKPQSRLSFIIFRQLPSTISAYIHFDAYNLIMRNHPGFQTNGPSTADVGVLMRYLNVLILAGRQYYFFQFIYKVLSIAMLLVGLYRPEDWPDLMGDWFDAYTVRRSWSRTWHQMFRRLGTAPGNLIAHRWLRLKPKSHASACIKLFVAFSISGFIHQIGDYAFQKRNHVEGNLWTAGGSMKFFVSQAAVIMIEATIIGLGKRIGIRDGILIRLLGYTWTLSWFALSLPMWVDPMYHNGANEWHEVISPIGWLWNKDWTGESVKIPLPLKY